MMVAHNNRRKNGTGTRRVFLLVVVLLFSASAFAQRWGKVTYVVGSAKMMRGSRQRNASINLSVNAGDRIQTGAESMVDVTQLAGDGVIKVTENTRIEISDQSVDGNTHTRLFGGEIIVNLKKMTKKRQARFSTPTAVATIRGTAFSLAHRVATKTTTLSMFSGTLLFRVGQQLLEVQAGRKLIVTDGKIRQSTIPRRQLKAAQDAAEEVLDGVDMPEGTDEEEEIPMELREIEGPLQENLPTEEEWAGILEEAGEKVEAAAKEVVPEAEEAVEEAAAEETPAEGEVATEETQAEMQEVVAEPEKEVDRSDGLRSGVEGAAAAGQGLVQAAGNELRANLGAAAAGEDNLLNPHALRNLEGIQGEGDEKVIPKTTVKIRLYVE